MAAASLPRKKLDDLKLRHLAFLEERLGSVAGREQWLEVCREGYDWLLSRTIREVVRPDAVLSELRDVLTPESVRDFFGPLLRTLNVEVLAYLKKDETMLGDYVPDTARVAIDTLLERRDLIPDALVRKLFEQQAVQDAIYDTLHDGLTQFNTTVNPFFADWGLPSFLRRMPIGGSVILASMEALRGEFERRLEPEMRKFLTPFSRRATGQLAEMFLAKTGDPKYVELRKNLVAFLYSQSIAELLARVDEQAAGDVGEAVEHILLRLLEGDRLGLMLSDGLQAFVDRRGDETVGEWMQEIGADGEAFVERWADLAWPGVRRMLDSPFVHDVLRRIVEDFYGQGET